jgi:formylglycine-generating enzyme required for sulfatase activity
MKNLSRKTGLNRAVRVTVAALSIVLGLGAAVPAAAQCPGDLNADGVVNGADLGILLAAWGECPTSPPPTWAVVLEQYPDPAVIFDPATRAAIIATGLPWRVMDAATGIEMVLIPPSGFDMGCSGGIPGYDCQSIEYPIHYVRFGDPFYLGRYEVTQAQWVAVMGYNPSIFQSSSAEVPEIDVSRRPVENVTWGMANVFMNETGMRLPSEAEWEYACRAGVYPNRAYHNFDAVPQGSNNSSVLSSISWYGNNSGGQTRPVGGKKSNGFGLHDMAGNVSEFVNDVFSGDYYTVSPEYNPQGPIAGSDRVRRGGNWSSGADPGRCSHRGAGGLAQASSSIGFRVARYP